MARMSYFGFNKPVVYLQDSIDPANNNLTLTLPDPSVINSNWEKEERSTKTRGGRIVTRQLGYRFSVEYEWVNISIVNIANIIKIANWEGKVVIVPHSEMPVEFTVKVTGFDHSSLNNKVSLNSAKISFLSTILDKIWLNLDAIFTVQEGGGDGDGGSTKFMMTVNNEYIIT